MSPTAETTTTPAFDVEQVRWADGRLEVRGRWSGVRGQRFVRPTLTGDGLRLLADLEHKPWTPDADPWVAVFPCEEPPTRDAALELAVSASIVVALPARAGGERFARTEAPAAPRPRIAEQALAYELDAIRATGERHARERDEAVAARLEAERELASARAERDRAVARLEAMRRERSDAHLELESARAQLRRAEEEREVARRARTEVERAAERLTHERDVAERRLARLEAEHAQRAAAPGAAPAAVAPQPLPRALPVTRSRPSEAHVWGLRLLALAALIATIALLAVTVGG